MPHLEANKKRAINRLRRISGQVAALETAIAEGRDCAAVLQQIAAMRGAVNGLMREVMESHLRESFGHEGCTNPEHEDLHRELDAAINLITAYIK